MEALSPPVFLLQFLSLPSLLIFTISMSWHAFCPGHACDPFHCGGYVFEFPCGEPALQLDCDHDMPLIDIKGSSYYILQAYSSFDPWVQNLTIVDRYLRPNGCNVLEYGNIAALSDPTAIKFGCSDDWYYSPNSSSTAKYCRSQLLAQLPVNTPEIPSLRALPNENLGHPNESCTDCQSNKGFCFYDTNTSAIIQCNTPSGGKSNIAVRLGCAFGGVAVAVVALLLFIFYAKRRKSSSSSKNLQLYVVGKSGNSRSLLKVEEFLQDYSHQAPARYSYSRLKKITNNFANKLGEGGFGVVYKVKLQNGNLVAVKILDQSRQCEIQFMNEIATIGRTHHFNLVHLMGYCFEEFRSALVYEYMVNGSLEKFIFVEKDKPHMLSWEQLYSIALCAARGIAYLHQDCDRRIVHFDIKPHNILLDADFTAKVSDFGLAKLCGRGDDHVSITATRGTPGYVAPELWSKNLGPVTDKSDVYSFGMLLLEIVGGRKNIDVQVSRPSEVYFPEWAFRLWERGELETWLRGKREMECEEEEKARRLTKIGLWCIQYSSTDRPSMKRVVQMLEGNGDDVSNPPLPFHSALPGAQLLSSADESS